MNTDISIYVPVYNGEKTIEKCINSILKQTIQPKKILIINDKSEDKTSDILTKYLDKIEVINNEKNMGVSYARNFAIKNLKTKYIASIDADVELSNNWLEQLINIITEKKITLIGGKMYEKYINNPFNLWRSLRLGQNWGENDLLNPKFVFGCNNLLDVSKIDKIDNYRTDLEYFKTKNIPRIISLHYMCI